MARYSKIRSNYILQKRHRDSKKGTIYERDWVTIGERHILEPGKRPIYYDGNFLFTDNSRVSTRKRYKLSSSLTSATYDEVENAKAPANNVVVNYRSDDMRDYAYYGSCRELVRASALNILNTFPAELRSTDYRLVLLNGEETGKYSISNPFNIDLTHSAELQDAKDVNPLRYLRDSWEEYDVNRADIKSYVVTMYDFDYECLSNNEGKNVCLVTITDEADNTFKLYGYYTNGNVLFGYGDTEDPAYEPIVIKPKDSVIEEYFSNLEGFEALMLSRNVKPSYTMRLVTPIEKPEKNGYAYVYREYTWPSDGYCIMADGGAYDTYLSALYDVADVFDEMWCDNLYRNMTHEAIKNFDWTYTRDYLPGEEDDFVVGGEIMTDLLHVLGRMFDDIKRSIDGIRMTNKVTLDGINNISDAEVTDKLELDGWDVTTIFPPSDYVTQTSDIRLSGFDIFEAAEGKEALTVLNPHDPDDNRVYKCVHRKWFDGVEYDSYTAGDVELEFMRQLKLSSHNLFRSKGTVHSLERMLAMFGLGRGVDYEIGEGYKTVKPIPLFQYIVGGGHFDNSDIVSETIGDLTHTSWYDPDTPFDNVPFGIIDVGNKKYLIPKLDDGRKELTNYMHFQCDGGWGKHGEDPDEAFTYTETLSYLRTLENVDDLLNLSPRELSNGDIYYVFNTIPEMQDETQDPEASYPPFNFFVCVDSSRPDLYKSWRCIIMDTEYEGFVDDEYYRKALYLDNIISFNTGNNPHTGYGNYDLGSRYDDNMKDPFSHILSTQSYRFNDDDFNTMDDYKYTMERYGVLDGNLEHTYDPYSSRTMCSYNKKAENPSDSGLTQEEFDALEEVVYDDQYDGLTEDEKKCYDYVCTEVERSEAQTEDMWACGKVKSMRLSGGNQELTEYYINDKTLVIKNLHEDCETYCEYFMNVIFPYLTQMIPSTTILILEGFSKPTEYMEAMNTSNMGEYDLVEYND